MNSKRKKILSLLSMRLSRQQQCIYEEEEEKGNLDEEVITFISLELNSQLSSHHHHWSLNFFCFVSLHTLLTLFIHFSLFCCVLKQICFFHNSFRVINFLHLFVAIMFSDSDYFCIMLIFLVCVSC